jgi:hypothetical protein
MVIAMVLTAIRNWIGSFVATARQWSPDWARVDIRFIDAANPSLLYGSFPGTILPGGDRKHLEIELAAKGSDGGNATLPPKVVAASRYRGDRLTVLTIGTLTVQLRDPRFGASDARAVIGYANLKLAR